MMCPRRDRQPDSWRRHVGRLRRYHEIADVGEITRRYFPMNAFDGVLTAVGIITGSYFGGLREASALISVLAAASVSLGVSGFYGSYLSERAERTRALRELEESTLTRLDDTDVGAAARYAAIAVAVVAGFASAIGGLLLCVPLALQPVLGTRGAFFVAWGLAAVQLFLLGVFLGRISRGKLVMSGLHLLAAGGVAFGLSVLLEVAGL